MMKMAITTSVPCRLDGEQGEQGLHHTQLCGEGPPTLMWDSHCAQNRAWHRDPHITATLSLPTTQPVEQKPQLPPTITSKKPPTSHGTATLPQTLSLDLQVIQGQAGTCFVHRVIGDCDACNNDQEETWNHENWLGTQTPAHSLPSAGPEQMSFQPEAQQELGSLKQLSTSR